MKQDIHITSHSATIRLRGDEFCVGDGDEITSLEACRIANLFIHTNAEISTPALKHAARCGIAVQFLNSDGSLLSSLLAHSRAGLEVRARQHALAANQAFRDGVAQELVAAKLRACTRLLRNYRRLLGADAPVWRELSVAQINLPAGNALLGAEGAAARRYWELFARLLAGEPCFFGRKARPPADPVNSMLSFGYHVLTGLLDASLHADGFEAALGFLHAPDETRPTLALDLVEPMRALAVDRLVLRLWNNRVIQPGHFESSQGAVYFNRPGRRLFLQEFHRWLNRPLRASLRPAGVPAHWSLLDAAAHNRSQLKQSLSAAKPAQFWPPGGEA